MQRTKGSGRLSGKQLDFIGKVAAAGRKHPRRKRLYTCLLTLIMLWFYLLAFCKKNVAALAALLCILVCAVCFVCFSASRTAWKGAEASDADRQLLLQQQKQLQELRNKVYGVSSMKGHEDIFIRALAEENANTVGWLSIPGTGIDYPVMQTPEDENYYLYRDFYGNENQNGSLLVSADCDLGNENTNWIIHGHNMKSGAMFGSLLNYRKKSYLAEHKLIYLDTLDGRRIYEIVAVFESQVYHENDHVFKYYQCCTIESWEEFDSFYNNIKRLSLYDTGVDAVYGDHFLTLSTCAYHTENGRFAVVAKELY